MATLDYSSVNHWIALSLKARRMLDESTYDLCLPEDSKLAVKDIAQIAADMGFTLRQGHRWYPGLSVLVRQLDDDRQTGNALSDAFVSLWLEHYQPPMKGR